jgi:hypothetical protein
VAGAGGQTIDIEKIGKLTGAPIPANSHSRGDGNEVSEENRKPRSRDSRKAGARTDASQLTATLKLRTAQRRPLNSPHAQPHKGAQPMNTNTATEYRNLPLTRYERRN